MPLPPNYSPFNAAVGYRKAFEECLDWFDIKDAPAQPGEPFGPVCLKPSRDGRPLEWGRCDGEGWWDMDPVSPYPLEPTHFAFYPPQ